MGAGTAPKDGITLVISSTQDFHAGDIVDAFSVSAGESTSTGERGGRGICARIADERDHVARFGLRIERACTDSQRKARLCVAGKCRIRATQLASLTAPDNFSGNFGARTALQRCVAS
ncbi:hypothetical protein A3B61_01520 [Candidatus Peribacteria bacterium RIFCSPLOWO2_01_FULL_53_10]|nr:MAG: hypothetical protein A3B61_01520 [Candidatus Peribacteria bacterium RIFCSPLOWO2_01_FULL_53_10]